MTDHELYLSPLHTSDNLKLLICHQCGRSLSIETTKTGALNWPTLKLIHQGNFFAIHHFHVQAIPYSSPLFFSISQFQIRNSTIRNRSN